jgi:hypothetical protein
MGQQPGFKRMSTTVSQGNTAGTIIRNDDALLKMAGSSPSKSGLEPIESQSSSSFHSSALSECKSEHEKPREG